MNTYQAFEDAVVKAARALRIAEEAGQAAMATMEYSGSPADLGSIAVMIDNLNDCKVSVMETESLLAE